MSSGVDDKPPESQPSGSWTFDRSAWEEPMIRGRARQAQPWGAVPAAASSIESHWAWNTERPWVPEDLVSFMVYPGLWKICSLRWNMLLQGRDRFGREVDLAFPSWPACRNFVERTTDLIVDEFSVLELARSDADEVKREAWAELVRKLGDEAICYRVRYREFGTWAGPTVRMQP